MFGRYTYVGNDPVNAIDPDGRQLQSDIGREAIIETAKHIGSFLDPREMVQDFKDSISDIKNGDYKAAAVSAAAIAVKPAKSLKKFNKANDKCCFVAGTLVETDEGYRPIEELEIGDLVLSKDVETGDIAFKPITDLITRHERVIWEVALSGENGASELFETTDDHPWWVEGQGWVETVDLVMGMEAIAADGQSIIISSITQTTRLDATYNLTVADYSTYFVGKQRVLVHNCDRTSVNQMQKKVEAGQAPKGIERFDKADIKQPNSKDHVHFKDGTSCNCDGTLHYAGKGKPRPTNKEKILERKWLENTREYRWWISKLNL